MKLYIYKNNLCDPAHDIGVARQFPEASTLDEYVRMFVSSIEPKFMSNWRIFITNDEVSFEDVDHHVLMDEPYGLAINPNHIEEVDVKTIALECNKKVAELDAQRRKRDDDASKLRTIKNSMA